MIYTCTLNQNKQLSYYIKLMDTTKDNLFQVLESGDRGIVKAHQEAIIMVGLTRVGKSTTFNWILNKTMIGKGNLNSYYVSANPEDREAAKLGNSYASVTLAPNVHVDYTPNMSLFDMAGYEDTRDYIGVLGVSYFLKALFEKVRKVRFLIVIDEHRFIEETGEGIIKTFNGFINMFKFNLMNQEMKDKLKKSIGVVVTRSKNGTKHYDYMSEVLEKIQDPGFVVENKDLVVELLKHVCDEAKIEQFKASVANKNPEECDFIDRFTDKLGWENFDLDQADQELKESVISVPFERDFAKLDEQQKELFRKAIEEKVSCYTQFSEILKVLFTNFKDNWEIFLEIWTNQHKIESNHHQMKNMFVKVREFLESNDIYSSKDIIEPPVTVSYEPISLVCAIEKMLEIYSIAQNLMEKTMGCSFKEAMEVFTVEFSSLVDCLGVFASNNEEEELILRLKFVLNRGFREFSKLYELHQVSIHNVKQVLPDNLNTVIGENKILFLFKFIDGLNSDILPKVFPTIEELEEYSHFFDSYQEVCYKEKDNLSEEDKELVKLNSIYFSKNRCNIEQGKADLLYNSGERTRALHCYIQTVKNYGFNMNEVEASSSSNEEKDEELDILSMKIIKIIRKVVFILKTLPDTEEFMPKQAALKLCQHHNMIDDACEMYDLILGTTDLPPSINKQQIYQDYSDYVIRWGRLEEGIKLLQKKIRCEEEELGEQKRSALKIKQVYDNWQSLTEAAKKRYSEWGRAPQDGEIQQQLSELQLMIAK